MSEKCPFPTPICYGIMENKFILMEDISDGVMPTFYPGVSAECLESVRKITINEFH
jgi:hypothetical protein